MKTKRIIHKSRLTLCLALVLTLTMAGAALGTTTLANTPGVIVNPSGSSYVNMRSGPSYDAGILTTLQVGASVEVTGVIGNWYSVWTEGMIGYIEMHFVSISGSGGGSVTIGATVNGGPLNVREAPSMRARVVTQLQTGTRVSVTEQDGAWTRISVGSVFGYVVSSYLTLDGVTPPEPSPPINTPNANATVRTANGGSLNLRASGNSSSSILGSFANGSRIRVMTYGDSWCRVQAGDLYGYMSTRYLVMDVSPSPSPSGFRAVVNNPGSGQLLNLREQPSTNSRSLGQYGNGTSITVVGVGTEWHRVSIGGTVGYMMAKYVYITDAGATPHKTVTGGSNGFVNLRSGPGYDYGVTKQVTNGSAASVVIPYPTWSKVLVRQGSGYIDGYMLNTFLR